MRQLSLSNQPDCETGMALLVQQLRCHLGERGGEGFALIALRSTELGCLHYSRFQTPLYRRPVGQAYPGPEPSESRRGERARSGSWGLL